MHIKATIRPGPSDDYSIVEFESGEDIKPKLLAIEAVCRHNLQAMDEELNIRPLMGLVTFHVGKPDSYGYMEVIMFDVNYQRMDNILLTRGGEPQGVVARWSVRIKGLL